MLQWIIEAVQAVIHKRPLQPVEDEAPPSAHPNARRDACMARTDLDENQKAVRQKIYF